MNLLTQMLLIKNTPQVCKSKASLNNKRFQLIAINFHISNVTKHNDDSIKPFKFKAIDESYQFKKRDKLSLDLTPTLLEIWEEKTPAHLK